MRCPDQSPSDLSSHLPRSYRGTVQAFGVCAPTMPSADFCPPVRRDYSPLSLRLPDDRQLSRGKAQSFPCVDARFIKHTPIAEGGLRCHVPAHPGCTTPHIWFLFVAPQFWIGLPSDPTSR